ncbi:MAG: hypothetical protein ACR2JO_08660 [Mycobacteriales bacterium]|jgi:hypothetical protein
MSETPIEDAREQEADAVPPGGIPASRLQAAPLEADEADAAEQAADVPIDEDEYR